MRDKVLRHAGFDRLNHWVTAAAVLILLATGLLPVLGVEFAWVTLHWWTGLVLAAAVLLHIVRSLLKRERGRVWIGRHDVAEAAAILRRTLRLGDGRPQKPGKYSFAQKLIHLAFAVVVLAAIATGCLMLVKIDTPWWERNPYWLEPATWGAVYVVHGLAALCLVTMVTTHVYFAFRPEKRMFLQAMIAGSISRGEYERYHDPERWRVDS